MADAPDRANQPRRAGWSGHTAGESLPDRFDPQSVLHDEGPCIERRPSQWSRVARSFKSETNKLNYPHGFDMPRGVRDDVPVVSAQAAWSDPGRLAD
jgi:hypothetical protein